MGRWRPRQGREASDDRQVGVGTERFDDGAVQLGGAQDFRRPSNNHQLARRCVLAAQDTVDLSMLLRAKLLIKEIRRVLGYLPMLPTAARTPSTCGRHEDPAERSCRPPRPP